MHDAGLVRGFEGLGNLPRQGPHLVERHGPARQPLREILALHELHRQGERGGRGARRGHVLQPEDLRDVGVVERRERLGLALEAKPPVGIRGERGRQRFDGDRAAQACVPGAVDLAHAARPKGREDFIGAEASAGREGHGAADILSRPRDGDPSRRPEAHRDRIANIGLREGSIAFG